MLKQLLGSSLSGTKSGGGFKFPKGLALNELNLVEKTSERRVGIGSTAAIPVFRRLAA